MKTAIAEGADRRFSAEAYARRKAAEKAAQGIIAETFDIENFTAATLAAVSGRLYLMKMGVCQGDPITRFMIRNNTAVTAATLLKFGMFRVTGDGTNHNATCLAVSADVSGTFGSGGVKHASMVAPIVATEDDCLFAGVLFTGTTGPAMYARLTSSVNGNGTPDGITGQAKAFAYNLSGQTDIAVGQVFSALAVDGNNAQYYIALRPE